MKCKFRAGISLLRFAVILATVIFCTSLASASKFWGIVGSHPVGRIADTYEAGADTLCWMSWQSAPFAGVSIHGWGLMDYAPTPVGMHLEVVRSADSVYTIANNVNSCSPEYAQAVSDALSDSAYVVLGHARRKTGTTIAGPHPFLYPLVYDFRALAHNGTIHNIARVEDSLGTGFAALDSFSTRNYASWHTPLVEIVDTEYYMMTLMKRLAISENYYWTSTAAYGTDMMYAIQCAVSEIAAISTTPWYIMNAAVATKDTMWVIYKKSDNADGRAAHNVSYWAPTAAPENAYRMAATYAFQGNNWVTSSYATGASGKIFRLVPGQNPDSLNIVNPSAAQRHPDEIRINPRGGSAGDQIASAAASDTVRGKFAVAWKSGANAIRIRHYNQMGLADGDEYPLATGFYETRSPAIAYSPNGDTCIVVWCEKRGSLYFNSLVGCKLWWIPQQMKWSSGGQMIMTITSPYNFEIDLPAIAMRPNGELGLVYQMHEWYENGVIDPLDETVHIYTVRGANGAASFFANGFHPDITALSGAAGTPKYAITWAAQTSGTTAAVFVQSVRSTGQMGVQTQIWTQAGSAIVLIPAVTATTMSANFAAAYWGSNTIQAKTMEALSGGGITILSTITGAATTGTTRIDVAARAGGSPIEVCYDHGDDVYIAVSSGANFVIPTPGGTPVNTTIPGSQRFPTFAISPRYNTNNDPSHDPDLYHELSQNLAFDQRRLVVWQAGSNQDGNGWGIVGRFYGIKTTAPANDVYPWYYPDPITGTPPDPAPAEKELAEGGDPDGNRIEDIASKNADIPSEYALYSPQPNPFNPTTTIRFDLPEDGYVELQVFDLAGRLIKTLAGGDRAAGSYQVVFNGADLPSGTYFARLQSGNMVKLRKLLLLK